jgi:hypothetical protein
MITLDCRKQPSLWRREKSRPKSWSVRQRSTADYFLYLQVATISVAEGNKQAKILESYANEQQLYILYIFSGSHY